MTAPTIPAYACPRCRDTRHVEGCERPVSCLGCCGCASAPLSAAVETAMERFGAARAEFALHYELEGRQKRLAKVFETTAALRAAIAAERPAPASIGAPKPGTLEEARKVYRDALKQWAACVQYPGLALRRGLIPTNAEKAADLALLALVAAERADAEKELQGTLDLILASDQRAIKRWQEAHPGNDHIWPDRTTLLTWILESNEALESRISRAIQELETSPHSSECECSRCEAVGILKGEK